MDDLEAAIALVYAQPPSDFVAARSTLVKELKAAKRKGEAARVAALRRPTKLAWAVGEAVRTAPEAADAFFAAVEALAEHGGDLRQRTADLRQAVATIVKGAEGVEPGEATAALLAIAADPDATGKLRLGQLADVPAGGGFGGLAVGLGAPAAEAAAASTAEPEAAAARPDERSDSEDDAKGSAAETEAAASRERQARQRAERIAGLEAERAEAAEAKGAAVARCEAARAAVDAAQAELDEAEAALDESRAALAEAEERLQEAQSSPRSA